MRLRPRAHRLRRAPPPRLPLTRSGRARRARARRDYACLYQGPRSEEQEATFKEGLAVMAHGYASPCGTTVLRRKHIPPCPEDPPSRSPPADGQPANLRGVVFAYGKRFGGFSERRMREELEGGKRGRRAGGCLGVRGPGMPDTAPRLLDEQAVA